MHIFSEILGGVFMIVGGITIGNWAGELIGRRLVRWLNHREQKRAQQRDKQEGKQ